MSKVYNYMVLAVGLTFILKFAGIPSGADAFLNYLGLTGDVTGLNDGTFYIALIALFAVGTGTGIAISFLTKSPSETFIIAPIASGIFIIIVSTFVSVVTYTNDLPGAMGGVVFYMTWMIFIPLIVGFGIAIIQFWRGSD